MTAATTPAELAVVRPPDPLQDIRERLVRLETVVYWIGGPVALAVLGTFVKVIFGGQP